MAATETVREYHLHIWKVINVRFVFYIALNFKHLSLLEELTFPFEGIVLYCKEVGKEGHQQDKAISHEDQTQLKQDNSFHMNTYMYIQETQNNDSFCLEFGTMCT